MNKFDSNLIRFRNIFKIPKILEVYQSSKINNDKLPKYVYQMKLYEVGMLGLGLFLGVSSDNTNGYNYNFLIIRYDSMDFKHPIESYLFYHPTKIDESTKKFEKLNWISFTPIDSLKKIYVESKNMTIEKFLNDFNEKTYKVTIF